MFLYIYILINVLKIGPDRPVQPVQPSTGHISGPVHSIKPFNYWTGYEPPEPAVEPVNRKNRTVLNEPDGSKRTGRF